ncbi:MAG: HAD-IIA family hydrolase [Acidimicrobiia bacterium]
MSNQADAPVIVCDLDGVLWRGDAPIPGSADAIASLRSAGRRVAFLTNNSSHRVQDVVDRLGAIGVPADGSEVISSAQAAAALLVADLPPGARVLTCAGPGVVEALTGAGYECVDAGLDPGVETVPDTGVDTVAAVPVAAVVVGFHREFDFARLDRAAAAVRAGARFVATNLDATYPGTHRVLPGAGALVAAVATASGRTPEVAGKPHDATVELVRARLGSNGVMVGDRPSTDGALAARLGWPFAMVLSGIGGHDPAEPIPTDPAPDWVTDDLGGLVAELIGYRSD